MERTHRRIAELILLLKLTLHLSLESKNRNCIRILLRGQWKHEERCLRSTKSFEGSSFLCRLQFRSLSLSQTHFHLAQMCLLDRFHLSRSASDLRRRLDDLLGDLRCAVSPKEFIEKPQRVVIFDELKNECFH